MCEILSQTFTCQISIFIFVIQRFIQLDVKLGKTNESDVFGKNMRFFKDFD